MLEIDLNILIMHRKFNNHTIFIIHRQKEKNLIIYFFNKAKMMGIKKKIIFKNKVKITKTIKIKMKYKKKDKIFMMVNIFSNNKVNNVLMIENLLIIQMI
jgi:hypothetical protein